MEIAEQKPSDPTPGDAINSWENMSDLGPIAPLLCDDSVNDILINGYQEVFVERDGKLVKTDVTFPDEAAVRKLAEAIVKAIGRTLDGSRPLVDARLSDGSRVNIIAPPLAVDGTMVSIRKFSRRKLSLDMMVEQGNMSEALSEFLKIATECKMNIIISGGTGSGKTTLLNAVSTHIGQNERVVTVEDAAELQLQQPHVIRLETQPLKLGRDPKEEVSVRDLVKNALRMRPDRIIVGEVRGMEAFDMLQAMNTGHEGSLTTIHANHPRDALARLENMISMANFNIPMRSMRAQIASAVHIIVQISRMHDGVRRVTYVSEVAGLEGDIISMNDLFQFVTDGDGENGRLKGEFKWTGIVPKSMKRVAYYGQMERLGKVLGMKVPKKPR
ncbi:MAG: CpaF family protein [Rickettsiales bacterium]